MHELELCSLTPIGVFGHHPLGAGNDDPKPILEQPFHQEVAQSRFTLHHREMRVNFARCHVEKLCINIACKFFHLLRCKIGVNIREGDVPDDIVPHIKRCLLLLIAPLLMGVVADVNEHNRLLKGFVLYCPDYTGKKVVVKRIFFGVWGYFPQFFYLTGIFYLVE